MRISDVLKTKGGGVTTLGPTATVHELVELLSAHRIGSVMVVSRTGELVGAVNERDVVNRLGQGGSVLEMPVSALMQSPLTCEPDDSVDAVLGLMTDRRTRHVAVLSEGLLVGLVSIGDLVKSRIEDLRHERDQLSTYISGSSS